MKLHSATYVFSLTTLVLSLNGCGERPTTGELESSPPPATTDSHAGHDHDEHAHPSHGPHDGDLVELGDEEYHAEVVHDDAAGSVTVYILNGEATEQVPIAATEVTINAKHDGSPEQFQLLASPDVNDPEGKCSRFISNDPDLAARLDDPEADPRLVLSIDGKSYRGEVAHDHDHAH
ncbi:MAG: hypothetical protein KDA52_21650 [Planctomycetaceae bacterium]|nr:hypothetical protein [Planctomycetaceae bacterium]